MKPANIIILIVVVYLALMGLYLVYKYYNVSLLIQGVQSLNTPSSGSDAPMRLAVPYTAIDKPTNVRYFYGLWVFVDSNIPPDRYNILFNKVNGDFILSLYGRQLWLHALSGTAAGRGKITPIGTYDPSTNSTDASYKITDNFLFQKWVHVLISVDGNTVDAYLDGKLAGSTNMKLPAPNVSEIHIGNIYTQGKLTRFRQNASPTTPQGAWNEYKRGNGQSGLTGKFMPYGVSLALSRNGKAQQKINLF